VIAFRLWHWEVLVQGFPLADAFVNLFLFLLHLGDDFVKILLFVVDVILGVDSMIRGTLNG
jgi:hypothetical protein